MAEWVIIGVVTISAALFAIGGTGFKWARRFVLPVVLGVSAYLLGIPLVRCLVSVPLIVGAMCLPYGTDSPVWQRVLTAIAFGLCMLPLASGMNALFCAITPAIFGALYILSLKKQWMTWKLVELATGFCLGSTVVLLALTKGA